jgi:hypothetical protein
MQALNPKPVLLLLFVMLSFSAREAQAIRPVDPIFLEEDCQLESGVHPSAVSTEVEIVSFNSTITPGEVPVVCPKGFQVGEKTHTATGGSCTFRIAPPSTPATKLFFSCKKNTASECSETGGTCSAKATVRCVPIAMKASTLAATERCRTPGLYGQMSALSSALLAGSLMSLGTDTLAELQGGKPIPTAAPAAATANPSGPDAQQEPAPQSLSFPGRNRPVKVAPAR